MIESGLVYVHSTKPTKRFVGCGAVVEGGYVATCRHVWRMATEAAAKSQPDEPLNVEIEYPGSWDDGTTIRHEAGLVDTCEGLDGPAPDLVLLLPAGIPSGVMALQLAAEQWFEVGEGYALAGLKGLDESKPNEGRDVRIEGRIPEQRPGFDGRRQFTGDNPQSYWSNPGSSGSPVFRKGGQQLAGILSLSELGGRHEAFVVPATTILRYVERLLAKPVAAKQGIDPTDLQQVLEAIGARDAPLVEIPARLQQFVEGALSRAAEPVRPSNDGTDIEAAIGASRAKLRALDARGARDLLQTKIAEEKEARTRRLLPLLRERAEVERLTFDYEAAKMTLTEITPLAPDDVWVWISLGELWQTTGPLESAAHAYRGAEAAARRTGNERDLSVSQNKIGDVLVAQGEREQALAAYRAEFEISETLARRDPANTEWQRDLMISCWKISDNDPAAARAFFVRALDIVRGLEAAGRLSPVDAWIPEELARHLALAEK
jgi:tetratricopeptide (TPR) repeat protein